MLKVSLIMPVYNAEKTIRCALESAINQTYENVEIIVIDGQSTDKTVQVIEEYRDHIDYFVSEKDKGYADALNKGIEAATGDYSIILAADDFFLPKGVEIFVNSINGNPDVWCGNMLVLKERGIVTKFNRAKRLEDINQTTVMAHPATFFKIKAFEQYGNYDINYNINSDSELILRWYKNGAKFQLSDEFISLFTCGGISTTDDMEDNVNNLTDISQGEEIAIKYGISKEEARNRRIKHIKSKRRIEKIKNISRKLHILKLLYFIGGQKPLSKKEIQKFGIPLELVNEY